MALFFLFFYLVLFNLIHWVGSGCVGSGRFFIEILAERLEGFFAVVYVAV